MRSFLRLCFGLLIFILLPTEMNAQTDSITDREGNTYKIIEIGEQWWMAENLKATKYANGDSIPYLSNAEDWKNTAIGAYCYYENNSENISSYGNLYNWHAISDARGICPEGWHVPSDRDWMILEKFLGMSSAEAARMTAWRGTNEGDKLKHESYGGNNASGFSALGTGYRDPQGIFKAMGTDNDYWTSTAYMNNGNVEGILRGFLNNRSSIVRNFHVPGYGFCVRCIRKNATVSSRVEKPESPWVYPNPAGSSLNVLNPEGKKIIITDLLGQKVLSFNGHSPLLMLDISGWSPGIYFLNALGDAEAFTAKIIKEYVSWE